MQIKYLQGILVSFLFLFCALANESSAQNNYVEKMYIAGRITDQTNGYPLPGATIFVEWTTIGCISTPNGYYRLRIHNDSCLVSFSFVGFEKQSVKLNREKVSWVGTMIERPPIDIQLIPENSTLGEINVVSEKERIVRMSDTEVSTVALSPKLIEKLPNFGEVDIMRSFQLLPGISGSNETSAGLYVRGGTPDQNLILFDGMTVYHVDHFYGFFSAFNANSIDDVKLYKGCFPAKYGGRLSSVMELQGKKADIDRLNWSVGASLLSVNGMLELPIVKNKLALQVSARRSYTDIIKSGLYKNIFALYDDSSNDPGMGGMGGRMGSGQFGRMTTSFEPTFYFYDLNTKLTWFASEKDELSLAFYNGHDVLDNSRENTMMRFNMETNTDAPVMRTIDESDWGNLGASAQWKRQWNTSNHSNLFVSYSNYFANRQRGNESDEEIGENAMNRFRSFSFYEDNNVKDFSVSFDHETTVDEDHFVDFGAKYTRNNISYQYALSDTTFLVNNENIGGIYALYAQDRITLFDKLNLNIGARLSYYDLLSKVYFEPRATATYDVSDKVKLTAGWGKFNQFIARTVREDIMAGSNDFWYLADGENVPVSESFQYLAGISYENPKYLFSVEGYYKPMNGLSEFTMRYANRRFDNQTNRTFFTGSGVAKGVEVLAQKKVGNLTGWLAYTLGSVVHNFPEINGGKDFYALHDQTHEFKAVATQSIKNLDISATWIYATGTPYTAPEGIYEITLLNGDSRQYIHVSDKNAYRLPNYSRVDLSVNYNFYIGNARAVLGASVFNLLNHENIWYKEFEQDNETGDLYETNIVKLGFTPNVSFKVYLR